LRTPSIGLKSHKPKFIKDDKEEKAAQAKLEVSKTKTAIIRTLQDNGFGSIGPILSDAIDELLPRFPDLTRWQWAAAQSVAHGVRTWAYFAKVLEGGPEGVPQERPQPQQRPKTYQKNAPQPQRVQLTSEQSKSRREQKRLEAEALWNAVPAPAGGD